MLFVIGTAASARHQSHKISSGDNLSTIARKYHTSVASIARANGISEKKLLKLGDNLVIPGKGRTASSVGIRNSGIKNSSGKHVVSSGDNLWTIAKRYKTTPEKLAKANGLSEKSLLQLGDKLVIPGKHAVKAKRETSKVARSSHSAKNRVAAIKAKHAAKIAKVNSGDTPTKTKLIRTALAYCGTRYRSGGTSRGGFDCSGFVRYVYQKYGLSLPHSSAAQSSRGVSVSRSQLKAGDLVFFQTNGRGISHVGIYMGGGKFVHASNHGRGVTTDSVNSAYYSPRYRGARRVK
jgi:cell wall-associated NlpC family hydrolase